jgi:glucarate dehydratase
LAEGVKGARFRYNRKAAPPFADAINFGLVIEGLNNDCFEDEAWRLNGIRHVQPTVRIPTAANTSNINFGLLAMNVGAPAIDVVLLEDALWGGVRPRSKAAGVCQPRQAGVAASSSGELCIQLSNMLQLRAVRSNPTFASEGHYHHLDDNVIDGCKVRCVLEGSEFPMGRGWA